MSDFFNPSETVTTKTHHECAYCGKSIESGTSGVLVESGKFYGEFFRRYACPSCGPLVSEFWDYADCNSANIQEDWRFFLQELHPEMFEEDD